MKDIINNKLNKFDYIDAFRGIAIVMVFLIHASYWSGQTEILQSYILPFHLGNLISLGQYGVSLFFMISAFTLFHSLSVRAKVESSPIRNYLIRRFFRIAPAYYSILFIIFLINLGFSYNPNASLKNLLLHIFFINGLFPEFFNNMIGVEWSVSTEVAFYLTLPLAWVSINWIITRQKINKFLVIAILLAISLCLSIGSYVIYHNKLTQLSFYWLYFSPIMQYYIFVIGILLYLLISDYKRTIVFKYPVVLMLIIIIFIIILAIIEEHDPIIKIFPMSILLFSFFYLIATNSNTIIKGIFINRYVRFIGKISFSIYLLHFLILSELWTRIWNYKPVFMVLSYFPKFINYLLYVSSAFLFTVLLSYILWKAIEQQGIKLGSTIIKKTAEWSPCKF